MVRRGGNPGQEEQHGKLLAALDADKIWGWDSPAGRQRVARRVAWLRATCGLKPGLRAMECGCGTGIFTRSLAQSGAEITAVDISVDLLERARTECKAPNVTFLHANLEVSDSLPREPFDAICGVSVLHHLDMPTALPALRARLCTGGRFAFSEPNLLNPLNKYYYFVHNAAKREARGTSPSEMAFRAHELRSYFEQAGFIVEGIAFRDFMHPSIPMVLIPIARAFEALAETLPLVRCLSGSLWIWGRNPG